MDEDFEALGRLLKNVAALRELAADAVTSFTNYGTHFDWCEARTVTEHKDLACDCGYVAQLKSLMEEQTRLGAFGGITP